MAAICRKSHYPYSKMCELCELCERLTNTPIWNNCKYATPLIFFNVYRIFFKFRAFYPQIIQNFVLPLYSHSALESHSRYRSTKLAGDQGLCSPQKSEIFGDPKKDASHVHRTLIALPSHTRTRVSAMRRSSSAKACSRSLRLFQLPFGRSKIPIVRRDFANEFR